MKDFTAGRCREVILEEGACESMGDPLSAAGSGSAAPVCACPPSHGAATLQRMPRCWLNLHPLLLPPPIPYPWGTWVPLPTNQVADVPQDPEFPTQRPKFRFIVGAVHPPTGCLSSAGPTVILPAVVAQCLGIYSTADVLLQKHL